MSIETSESETYRHLKDAAETIEEHERVDHAIADRCDDLLPPHVCVTFDRDIVTSGVLKGLPEDLGLRQVEARKLGPKLSVFYAPEGELRG